MSIADKLKEMLFEKLNHNCDVWYDPLYGGGWMFKSEILPLQRLGHNADEAIDFVARFDWLWIKEHLAKE